MTTVAHGYFDINLAVVGDTIKSALPVLLARLNALGGDNT